MEKKIQKKLKGINDGIKVCVGSACRGAVKPVQKRYHQVYHPKNPNAFRDSLADIILIIVLLGSIFLWGYVSFWYDARSFDEKIIFTIEAPEKVISSKVIPIKIHYENLTESTLDKVKIVLEPDNTLFLERSFPVGADLEDNTFEIHELLPKEAGALTLNYRVLAAPEELSRIKANLVYSAIDSDNEDLFLFRDKQKIITKGFVIESSRTVNNDFPEIIEENKEFSFVFSFLEEFTIDSPKKRFCFVKNPALEMKEIWPLPKKVISFTDFYENNEKLCWDSGELKDRKLNIVAKGVVPGENHLLQHYVEFEKNNTWQKQESAEQVYSILSPDFIAQYSVNDSNTNLLQLGEKYIFKTELVLDDFLIQDGLKFVLPLQSDFIDQSSIEIKKGVVVNNELIWPASSLNESFVFLASIVKGMDLQENNTHFSRLELQPYVMDKAGKQFSVSWNSFLIGTDMVAKISPRYYTDQGEQIGRGALPPKVGLRTAYWVGIELNNLLHTAEETKLELLLPENVSWTGKASVSGDYSFVFDEESRILTLNLGRVESRELAVAGVELQIIPTEENAGRAAILATEARLSGVDLLTKKVIFKKLPPVIAHDVFAREN